MPFHHFEHDIGNIALPEKFTFPFCYKPHPLCVAAATEVQAYIAGQSQWHEELKRGKMFGVLVVRHADGEIGYISAYSGNIDKCGDMSYFVPPIYDALAPDGFFKQEEREITRLNHHIESMENDADYRCLQELWATEFSLYQKQVEKAKAELKQAKVLRDARRKFPLSEDEAKVLIRESQFQKAEFRRMERRWKERMAHLEQELSAWRNKVNALKQERKERSAALQQRLFEQIHVSNARGERRDLFRIFRDFGRGIPPSGAGDCAAPKLLQYAYNQCLTPLCMAEFWWGDSPQAEIRHHGFYYPSCRSKCEPILSYMLHGLDVEDNPLEMEDETTFNLGIIYEDDEILAVNKPAGMLSVQGKSGLSSVYGWLVAYCPTSTGPMIVHRLDMQTSGIMLAAKTKYAHQNLQAQFKKHHVRKRYIALLDGLVEGDSGTIDLPLCPDPYERPRQMVSGRYGKSAVTHYEVLGRKDGRTRIAFYPQTGRTHQLRVHAAHPQGLNAPIVGDMIYGQQADRLYLHAEQIEFHHPISGKFMRLKINADF